VTRGNDSANTTAAALPHVRPLIFVQFQFDGGTLYLHNGIGSYQFPTPVASPAETWLGIGSFGQISEIEETAELSPYRVTFTLDGTDPSLIAAVDAEPLYERLAIVYLGFIGDDGALVAQPDERWRGFMDVAQITVGTITITAETEMARFFRSNGRQFTDEDQQEEYSGDTGFQFLDQMIDIDLRWGPDGSQVLPSIYAGRALRELMGGIPRDRRTRS
jgi:hypothetical protein